MNAKTAVFGLNFLDFYIAEIKLLKFMYI